MSKNIVSPLITAKELQAKIANQDNLILIDARFNLMNEEYGDQAYAEKRIPKALRVDLAIDLCREITPQTGRHPLKPREELEGLMQDLGINDDTDIVIYDDKTSMFAIHLWWVLRWLGHENVQVLEGGFNAWVQSGADIEEGTPRVNDQVGNFVAKSSEFGTVEADEILQDIQNDQQVLCVIDARGAARYRGEVEPMDPVAGHIPKAINRPFEDNLNADGTFKTPEVLKAEWTEFLKDHNHQTLVHQCGSGISACYNIFAMNYAGLGVTTLYPGSWSEWCKDPNKPVAQNKG